MTEGQFEAIRNILAIIAVLLMVIAGILSCIAIWLAVKF